MSRAFPPGYLEVAGLAARVAQLAGQRGTREGKLEAGRLVFEACYRGDEARFASRGRGSVTLRALAAAAGGGLSVTTLWRLARAHVAAASLPATLAACLSLAQLTTLGAVEPGAAREAAARRLAGRDGRGATSAPPATAAGQADPGQQARGLERAARLLGRMELVLGTLDAAGLSVLAPRLERLAAAARAPVSH